MGRRLRIPNPNSRTRPRKRKTRTAICNVAPGLSFWSRMFRLQLLHSVAHPQFAAPVLGNTSENFVSALEITLSNPFGNSAMHAMPAVLVTFTSTPWSLAAAAFHSFDVSLAAAAFHSFDVRSQQQPGTAGSKAD